jgi:hypothetical protein
MAKASTKAKPMAADGEPEAVPAEMGAGASEDNANDSQANDAGVAAQEAKAEEEGFRDEQGRFTGNPPTDTERLDAICDILKANGWSLPKVLHR